jgi:hypothetical protein
VFCYMGVLSGYLRASLDLYQVCKERGDLEPRMSPPTEEEVGGDGSEVDDGRGAEAAGGSSSPSSSSSRGGGASVTVRRRVDVKALHRKAKGVLNYVFELLASDLLRILCIMMAIVTEPMSREHSTHMIFLRGGISSCRLTFALLACGVWKCTVCAIFRTLLDLSALERMTMDVDLGDLHPDKIDEMEAYRCLRRSHFMR